MIVFVFVAKIRQCMQKFDPYLKTRFFVTVVVIFLVSSEFKSQTVEIGMSAGVGMSQWRNNENADVKSNFAGNYGLCIGYTCNKYVSLGGEILSQRTNFRTTVPLNGQAGFFSGQISVLERRNYLSIPFYVTWSLIGESVSLIVKTGAYYNFLYSHDKQFPMFTATGSTNVTEPVADDITYDAGGLLAMGMRSRWGKRTWFTLETRINAGLTDQSPNTAIGSSFIRTYMMMVGLTCKLGKLQK
jgi:hypothetical protein